ncbi:MAG TPA: hypothetical protein DDW55_02445 [Gammaproteobacteria bacterium]|nr:hypothetical protein [Gammaproteobacteria bacterium]
MYRSINTRTTQTLNWTVLYCTLLAVLLWLPLLHASPATPIGGLITWQGDNQLVRNGTADKLHPIRPLLDKDIIKTGESSWVMLELYDATRLVVGPLSELKISLRTTDNLHYLDLSLEKGLLRIVTGLACNRSVQDCVLNTPYGPLNLFSTRADIWVCEDGCIDSAGAYEQPPHMNIPAGRVVHVKGQLFREEPFGIQKRLLSDDVIALSDELVADRDSCAVIAFNDGSILSLREGQRVYASDPATRRGASACPDWAPEAGLDFRAMFVTRNIGTLSHGVFARVVDGHVRLGSESAETGIGRNEAAYMGNGPPVRISPWPHNAVLEQTPDPSTMYRRMD